MKEWINESHLWNESIKPRVYSLAVTRVSFVWRWQSGKDAVNYFTSLGEKTWHILTKVITAISATFHSGPNIQQVGGKIGAAIRSMPYI